MPITANSFILLESSPSPFLSYKELICWLTNSALIFLYAVWSRQELHWGTNTNIVISLFVQRLWSAIAKFKSHPSNHTKGLQIRQRKSNKNCKTQAPNPNQKTPNKPQPQKKIPPSPPSPQKKSPNWKTHPKTCLQSGISKLQCLCHKK